MLKGIDVSSWQGTIDWAKVKSQVDFVVIRCGWGGDFKNQDDNKWATNVAGAEKYGIPYGVYLYSYATTEAKIDSEVAHTLRLVGSHEPFCIYLDMEDKTTAGLGKTKLTALGIRFCKAVAAKGFKAGVYANQNWCNNYLDIKQFSNAGYSVWCAYWSTAEPKINAPYDIWQYSSSGSVTGISGRVDMNRMITDIRYGAAGSSGAYSSGSTSASTSSGTKTITQSPAYQAAVSGTTSGYGTYKNIVASIDHTLLKPYVLTVDRNSAELTYTYLQNKGVSGVVIEAGYLYTSSHTKVTPFRSPKVEQQIKAVSEAGLPFGFYFNAAAKNAAEARAEIYELSFIIRRWPPKLGVWITHDFKLSSINNTIVLDEYYERLVALGLISAIGLYVTSDQLSRIDWKTHQNRWFLWIKKHVDDLSEVDSLLQPEFFDV